MGEKQKVTAERDPQQVAASALSEARKIRFPKHPTPEQIRGIFLENQITQVIGHSLAEYNPNGTMVLPGEEWVIGIFETGSIVPPYQLLFKHQDTEDGAYRGSMIAYLNPDFSLNEHFGIRSHTSPDEQVKILKACLGFAARVIGQGEVIAMPTTYSSDRFSRFAVAAEAA